MKKLSLRPYHGTVWLCETPDELLRVHKRLTKKPWPHSPLTKHGGRFVQLDYTALNDRVFLIYGENLAYLAHEFAHVLLVVFRTIGHDPREGDGEPFCYMLSQLLLEAS